MTEELKPCPFCGSVAIGIRYEGQPALKYAFLCSDCGASTGAVYVGGTPSGSVINFDNPDAVKRWNTRYY
jgi:Lar family restriction alleviation protein